MLAAGQVPDQPGIDRSEADFAALCPGFQLGIVVEEPADLAG
jgi:hypothetical protein